MLIQQSSLQECSYSKAVHRSVHSRAVYRSVHAAEQFTGEFMQQSSLQEFSHSRAVYRSVHLAEQFTGVFTQQSSTGVFTQKRSLQECSHSRSVYMYRSAHTSDLLNQAIHIADQRTGMSIHQISYCRLLTERYRRLFTWQGNHTNVYCTTKESVQCSYHKGNSRVFVLFDKT